MSLAEKNHLRGQLGEEGGGRKKISLTTGRKWKNKADQNPRVKSEVYISGNDAKTHVWDCATVWGEGQSGCCLFGCS